MAAKVQIPDELKKDLPPTKWGKILGATPVVMAVVATMLAGLASSEMTKAQYDRSFAAQLQSKAGDQWSYYQAKKLRGAMERSTLDILEATTDVHPLVETSLQDLNPATVAALQKGELPFDFASFQLSPRDQAALDAVTASKSEGEISDLLARVSARDLIDDLNEAKMQALTFDEATKPVNEAIDHAEKKLTASDKSLSRDFIAARLRYMAARYDAESKLNSIIANIYELQVRQNNYSAERHHRRSAKFFYGMLGAQLAVIIATFAIAARQRNFLWSVAAAAGLVAVSFSVYVFLYV